MSNSAQPAPPRVEMVVSYFPSPGQFRLGMFHAAEFVSPGLATVIANVQPIIAAVLAHVFLGERLKAIGKIGLVVGLAGIAVIALPGLALKSRPTVTPTVEVT